MKNEVEVKEGSKEVILDRIFGIKLNLNEIESIRFSVPKLTCEALYYRYILEIDGFEHELERVYSDKDSKVHFKPLYHGGYKIQFKLVWDGYNILFYVNFYKGKRLQSQWVLIKRSLKKRGNIIQFSAGDGYGKLFVLRQNRKIDIVFNDWLDNELDSAKTKFKGAA